MLRLLHLSVTPTYVQDDGTDLVALEGATFQLKASDIDAFPAFWAEQFAALRETHSPKGTST